MDNRFCLKLRLWGPRGYLCNVNGDFFVFTDVGFGFGEVDTMYALQCVSGGPQLIADMDTAYKGNVAALFLSHSTCF